MHKLKKLIGRTVFAAACVATTAFATCQNGQDQPPDGQRYCSGKDENGNMQYWCCPSGGGNYCGPYVFADAHHSAYGECKSTSSSGGGGSGASVVDDEWNAGVTPLPDVGKFALSVKT